MLRRWLVFLLAVETIVYLLIATVLVRSGWGVWVTLAMIFAMALIWRVSHALSTFLLCQALRWRDGRQDRRGLQALWGEFLARLISFNLSQPFEQWVMPDEPASANSANSANNTQPNTPPLLLVHGYFSNRGMWVMFRKQMLGRAASGEIAIGPIYTVTLHTSFTAIEILAEQLHTRIESICAETGQSQLILFGHSMGGLVARAYLARYGRARIQQLITLGTPHHGTQLGKYGLGASGRQMRAAGNWFKTLAAQEMDGQSLPPTTSIYTVNDDLVYPPESSRLTWADNIAVDGLGHIGLLFSTKVIGLVVQAINAKVPHPRAVQDKNV